MLFSRRKRATAVEPEASTASVHSNGAAPDVGLDEAPTVEVPPVFIDPLESFPTVATPATGALTVPVAAPGAAPSVADPPEGPAGMPLAPGDETGDADLDRFFAALRQVVHDARERLPLESDRPDPPDLITDAREPSQQAGRCRSSRRDVDGNDGPDAPRSRHHDRTRALDLRTDRLLGGRPRPLARAGGRVARAGHGRRHAGEDAERAHVGSPDQPGGSPPGDAGDEREHAGPA